MKILLASITQAVSAACAIAAVVLQMAAPPPAVEELAALDVAPENRCAAYHAHVDYRYSRALERMAAQLLGGYFGAYEAALADVLAGCPSTDMEVSRR